MVTAGEETRLATELQLFGLHKEKWLNNHRGQYVVIKDSTILNFFPSFEGAYRAGVDEWGIDTDFLVKQIVDHEPVFFIF